MKKQYIMTQIKELIKKGANIEIYDNNYNTNSLFEMAKEAKRRNYNWGFILETQSTKIFVRFLKEVKNLWLLFLIKKISQPPKSRI